MCSWRHLVNAMEVTAGLAESNGNLLPGRWFKVICGLTAYTPGSAPGPTISNECERILSLPLGTHNIPMLQIERVSCLLFFKGCQRGNKMYMLSIIKQIFNKLKSQHVFMMTYTAQVFMTFILLINHQL